MNDQDWSPMDRDDNYHPRIHGGLNEGRQFNTRDYLYTYDGRTIRRYGRNGSYADARANKVPRPTDGSTVPIAQRLSMIFTTRGDNEEPAQV